MVQWRNSYEQIHRYKFNEPLFIPIELYDDKVQYLSQPLFDILCMAEKYIGELEEEKASALSAYLLANILQLFKTLLELACLSGKSNVESTTKDFIFGNVVKNEFITNLLVHENVSVRSKTLEFFGQVLHLKLELLRNRNVSNEEYAHAKKKKKTKKTEDKTHISVQNLKSLIDNLCELAKVDVREELLLLNNLTYIYEICELDPSLSKLTDGEEKNEENDYLSGRFVYKKARSFYIHEKFHINGETSRRTLFYKLVLNILKRMNEQRQRRDGENQTFSKMSTEMKEIIIKHLSKDRKQSFLEEIAVEIEKEIQDLDLAQ